ncbi:MAG: cysteine hydrolase [Alcanivorax sp.]|jgi:nicotinamidase-related amidase|nr:cysteine hydrolase [Alcanivorax sp.]
MNSASAPKIPLDAFDSSRCSVPYPWPVAGRWRADDTALLAIDMQKDFLDPRGYFASLGESLEHTRRSVAPARNALAAARDLGLTVVHTREGHRRDLSDLNDCKRLRAARAGAAIGSPGPLGRLLVRDEQGWDFIDEMRPLAGEPVVDKCGNGAFYATDLEQILRSRGIRHLLLLGVTTDVCVSSTMREANDRGFDCLLLEDCCGAATPELHQGVLNSLEREGGIFGAYADSRAFFEQYLSATAG